MITQRFFFMDEIEMIRKIDVNAEFCENCGSSKSTTLFDVQKGAS
jgi:hypothetical protein